MLLQEYTRDGPIWKNDENSMQSSSHVVNLIFLSERCLVSKAAKQLMELVHLTLQVYKQNRIVNILLCVVSCCCH